MSEFPRALLPGTIIEFRYVNWRGAVGMRKVRFSSLAFGSNEYHQEKQWFLNGFDLLKNDDRHFALKDINLRTLNIIQTFGDL